MRKPQKEQIMDLARLLGQAHEEIKKAIEKQDVSTTLGLLADCQDGAISMGELIEKTEGGQLPTISLLEEYCEILYQIHEGFSEGQLTNAYKVYKTLNQSYIKIQNSIRNDIRIRKEAVFLPYKASMWDSLESIWRAAEEDPDCDAYVVPIPYYDKNPDGSFREIHYEGNQYPKDVPVVWYEDYDFENRRPDMVFIHNPYDECNYVTSVMPFFYASNLKQYTEELVYIPYFVLGEIDPGDQNSVKGMSHFCTLPGVIHADKVVVQSETMRQIYIDVLTKYAAAQGYDRKYWEQKILGLGSPKMDRVRNTKREDLEVPEDWMVIIRKPDGGRRKVILYNTSVTALLQHDRQMLEKIEDVLHIFRENREEVALLWRPHPLIKATIEAMRPGLWAGYAAIVARYRKEGWGIYDDTADMDRAVALSDAYYGDPSSIVQLFREVEKPVMIQNVQVREIVE